MLGELDIELIKQIVREVLEEEREKDREKFENYTRDYLDHLANKMRIYSQQSSKELERLLQEH